MKIYTSERMKRIEAAANEKGLSYLDMMDRAGIACADTIYKKLVCKDKKIAVVCGKGKNGGDGFVATRRLKELGCEMISVILVGGIPSAEDSVTMFSRMPSIPVFVGEQPEAKSRIEGAEIILDAVFGFGFKGEPDEATAEIFHAINASDAKVVSIDLPSGAECDTAKVCESCIKADLTLAISCRKPAHVLTPAKKYCGRVMVIDIGLDNEAVTEEFFTFSDKPVPVLPARKADAHKGDFGKVLSICGSMKYPGAAVLAATGAVKIGAGLVFAAFPEKAYPAISSKLTEPVMLPLPCCQDGFLARGALEKLLPETEKSDTVLIGCGLGQTLGTASVFEEILAACKNNVVIDADGINLLSANINIPKAIKGHTVITPHPGEMARLVGLTAEQVNSNRLALTKAVAREYGIVVVLKGANTVVSDGERTYVNRTGNPGMARGGCGDLLAGMTAGLLAQGFEPFEAAVAAVYLHGKAGDEAAKKLSVHGMTPSDMAAILPELLSDYEH